MNTTNFAPEVRTVMLKGEPTEVMNAAALKHMAWATHTPEAKKLRKLIARKEAELRAANPLLTESAVVQKAVVSAIKEVTA